MFMKRTTLLLLMLCFCVLLSACGESQPATDAPEGCLRADGEATDFNFCYPNTWELDRNDGMISVKTNVGQSGVKAYASVSVMAFTLEDTTQGAFNYWDDYKADLKDTYGDKISFAEEKKAVKLYKDDACLCRYSIKLSDVTYLYEQVICVRYGQVYILTLTTPDGTMGQVSDGWKTIQDTFVFEN